MAVSKGAPRPVRAYDEGTRRTEILATAASLIATSGLRTSMHDIADAAGIHRQPLSPLRVQGSSCSSNCSGVHGSSSTAVHHALHTLDTRPLVPGHFRGRSQRWVPRLRDSASRSSRRHPDSINEHTSANPDLI